MCALFTQRPAPSMDQHLHTHRERAYCFQVYDVTHTYCGMWRCVCVYFPPKSCTTFPPHHCSTTLNTTQNGLNIPVSSRGAYIHMQHVNNDFSHHSTPWTITCRPSLICDQHLMLSISLVFDIVEVHCYVVTTGELILMSKYVAESINQ